LLIACGGKSSPDVGYGAYIVEGKLPAGSDFDEIVARLRPGGFVVVADPGTADVATIVAPSSPDGTFANSEFSVDTPATFAARSGSYESCPGTSDRCKVEVVSVSARLS
jgi:hypothetical protein